MIRRQIFLLPKHQNNIKNHSILLYLKEKMKKVVLFILLSAFFMQAEAQFTFYAKGYEKVEKSTKKVLNEYETKEIYSFSFTDKILIHIVFDDESDEVNDSQVYKITEVEELRDGLFEIETTSGVSGRTYTYRLFIDEDGEYTLTQTFKDESYNYRYKGTGSKMKTFIQAD